MPPDAAPPSPASPTPDAPPSPVTFDDVRAAAKRLKGVAHRTPVLTSSTLDGLCDAQVFCKCENFQRIGAFKFRGAYNALSRLNDADKRRGVLTYSSGNHAQGIALAGALLRIPTVIVMPTDAPHAKRAATQGYLADNPASEVVLYDRATTTREALGAALAAERGLTIIPPYDHPHVIAGQGTCALELIEDAGELDALFVCCGGGGLLSGCAIAAKALLPSCIVVGVEPALADDATRSFRTRELHHVEDPPTIADGVRTPSLGRWTFPLVVHNVDAMVTVSETEIARAMRFAWERMKIVIEPSGALGLAGVLYAAGREGIDLSGRRVGVIISGGNVDLDRAGELLAMGAPS